MNSIIVNIYQAIKEKIANSMNVRKITDCLQLDKILCICNFLCTIKQGTDEENIPFWSIKPSAIVKMQVAHPDVAKSLIRFVL